MVLTLFFPAYFCQDDSVKVAIIMPKTHKHAKELNDRHLVGGSYELIHMLSIVLKNYSLTCCNEFKKLEPLYSSLHQPGGSDIGLPLLITSPGRNYPAKYLWPVGETWAELALKSSNAHRLHDIFWTTKIRSSSVIIGISLLLGLTLALLTWKVESLQDIWFWALTFVCQQESISNFPKVRGIQILLAISSAVGMVALNVYTASLASDIATPSRTVSGIGDLHSLGFKYVHIEKGLGTFVHDYLMNVSTEFAQINEGSKKFQMNTSLKGSFHKALIQSAPEEKLFVAMASSRINRYMAQFNMIQNDVVRIPVTKPVDTKWPASETGRYRLALAFGNNTNINHALVSGLTKIKESGLMKRVQDFWMGPRATPSFSADPTFQAAGFIQIQSAFLIWISGCICSIVICTLEIAHARVNLRGKFIC